MDRMTLIRAGTAAGVTCMSILACADIYTSRVCNLFRYTPYAYFRSPSQSLAHDRNISPRAVLDAEHWEDGNCSSGEALHSS